MMTQMQTGATRRSAGSLDMYTGLALAGTVALIIATAILWMAGSKTASKSDTQTEMPWTIIDQR